MKMTIVSFLALALLGCSSVKPTVTQTVVANPPSVRLVTLGNTNQNYKVVRTTDFVNYTTVYEGTNGAPIIEVWDTSGNMSAFFDVKPN